MRLSYILLAAVIAIMMLSLLGCPPKPAGDGPAAVKDQTTGPAGEGAGADDKTVVIEGEEGKVEVTKSGEDETVTVVGKDGTTTIASSGSLPEGWPESIPIMPGFTVVSSVTGTQVEKVEVTMNVNAEGEVEIADVSKFYKELKDWKTDTEVPFSMVSEDALTLAFANGKEHLIVIASKEKEGKTTLVLQYSKDK